MNEPVPGEMPLMEHLRELRSRLMKAVVALMAGMVVSMAMVDQLILELRRPFDSGCIQAEQHLREGGYLLEGQAYVCELGLVSSPFEGVATWMWTTLLAGAVLAMPVISYQVWRFIAPG